MPTRSLGTLTLNLVADLGGFEGPLDRAARKSDKAAKKFQENFKRISAVATAATSSVVAATIALTSSQIDAAAEITRLSQVANTSTTEFQKYAAGAKALQIEQDKLADIFKDTSDKVGDFLQTGGGPLKDFFDNIAPQIGVTADQFRDLSGPKALELYVSSLEKANVSQNEMTFFMEAIASDSTLLLPLLQNGAQGFRDFGEAAESSGNILEEKTIAKANEAQAAMLVFQGTLSGVRKQIFAEVIPVFADLAGTFADVTNQGSGASSIGEGLAEIFKRATAVAFGTYAAFQLVGRAIGALGATVSAFGENVGDIGAILNPIGSPAQKVKQLIKIFENDDLGASLDRVKNTFAVGVEDIGETAAKYGEAIQSILAAGTERGGGSSETEQRIKNIAALLNQSREATQGQSLAVTESSRKATEALSKQEVATKRLAEEERKRAEEEAARRQARINASVVDIRTRLSAPEDQINQEFQRERELVLANTEITGKAQTELMIALEQERQAELAALQDQRLVQAEGIFTDLREITQAFADDSSGILRAAFIAERAAGVARAIVAIQTGIAMASATPFPGNLAAIASVTAATAGLVSTIQGTSIQGQAHDGLMSVPESGTYLLEKGERVTTERTSAKLDRTLDQVQSGGAGGGIKVVVVSNMEEAMREYLSTAPGERAVMAAVGNNRGRVRAMAQEG